MGREQSEGMDGHALLLPFDTDHPEFARGFEAGRVWALLQHQPDEEVDVVLHTSNAEIGIRMAEATRRRVRGEESHDGHWITLSFEAAEEELLTE
jgi:hypothetical protein